MASAAGGGADQALAFAGSSDAYAISTALPDQAYVTTLVGGAINVADALLGPYDIVFGTAILGGDASTTFDFTYRGDLLVGLVDDDAIIDLGSNFGPNVDLTFSEPGIYVLAGVVPESSTWAMMLMGFGGLGFAGYRGVAQNGHSGVIRAKAGLRRGALRRATRNAGQLSGGRKRGHICLQKTEWNATRILIRGIHWSSLAAAGEAVLNRSTTTRRASPKGRKIFRFFRP